jgi:AsmA protein
MGKLIRNIVVTFCAMIFVIILGAIALLMWVDPNGLKSPVEKALHQVSGQDLTIQGDINWTFFPLLSLEVNDVVLQNPTGFSQHAMLQLDQAKIGIRIPPLLAGKIHTNQIKLVGLNIFAETLKDGKNNWDKLLTLPKHITPSTEVVQAKSNHKKPATFMLYMNKISIVDSSLQWKNDQHTSQGKIKLKQFILDDLNTENEEFTFDLDARLTTQTNTLIPFKFSSRNQLDLKKEIFNTHYTFKVDNDMTTQGQLTVHLTNTMPFEGNMSTKGDMLHQAACTIQGNTDILNFNDCTIVHRNNNVKGNVQLTNWTHPQKSSLQGNIHADQLHIEKLNLQNFDTKVIMQNQRWQFNPITATLYQGHYQGDLTIDTQQRAIPNYDLKQRITGVQLQPLLRDLHKKQVLSGTLFSQANLNSQGKTITAIQQHANGQVNFTINNGEIQGLNISALMQNAYEQFKNQGKFKKSRTGTTAFNAISADFKLNEGLAQTNNLKIDSSLARVTAKGNINLASTDINFKADAHLNGNSLPQIDLLQKQIGDGIPFLVTGTLDNPVIRPDIVGLTKLLDPSLLRKDIGKNIEKATKKVDEISGDVGKQLKSLFD